MLPGFRFLFAAIVLAMSILVFGLGAAALLRAAHEEFASTPSWRASPEPVFAQQTEAAVPVLAMLRVESQAVEEKALDPAPAAVTPAEQPVTSVVPAAAEMTAKPAESEVTAKLAEPEVTAKPVETQVAAAPAAPEVTAAPAEPESTAAHQPENSPQPEAARPDMPVAEDPARQDPAPAQAAVAAAVEETKMAASTPVAAPEEVSAAASEAAMTTSEAVPAAPEPANPPASADAGIASTKIATLGGPPVTVEAAPPVRTTVARHHRSFIRRHVEARRKNRHHRVASRARVVQPLPQQAADPFGQSFATARRR